MTLSRFATPQRAKSFGHSFAMWAFGFFTTVLLIGLWGRSVATDALTLEESAHAVLESELVNERVTGWLADGIAEVSRVAPDDVADAVDRIAATPEARHVLDDLVDQAVEAALAPAGEDVTVDVSQSVEALVPVVVTELAADGIAADPAVIRAFLGAPDVLLSNDDQIAVSSARDAAGFLTRVLLVGLGGMILSGAAALGTSADKMRQMREFAVRLGISAITFAIILRVGAWAVDPRGGRSPVARGGAVLLASNGHVLAYLAIGAAVVVGITTIFIMRKRGIGPLAPRVDDGDDEPTEELPVLESAGV